MITKNHFSWTSFYFWHTFINFGTEKSITFSDSSFNIDYIWVLTKAPFLDYFLPFWEKRYTVLFATSFTIKVPTVTCMQRTSKSTPVVHLPSKVSSPYSQLTPKHLHSIFLPANQSRSLQRRMRKSKIFCSKSIFILAHWASYI